MSAADPSPTTLPARVALAAGKGWSADEFLCRLGPHDPAFEERHEQVTIALVLEGRFQYCAPQGRAVLYPGALMLGEAGTCYECGHSHSTGDRCLAFRFDPGHFAELADEIGGGRFRLARPMLPALPELAPVAAEIAAAAAGRGGLAVEELGLRLAEKVVALAGRGAKARPVSARDEARIARALRHIEAEAGEPLDLATLAGIACLSKYQFLRVFRRVTGLTPYQHLLALRLGRAALALRTGREEIGTVAFAAGFGDLSTFNRRFRRTFGTSPSGFRARASRSSG